MSSKSASSDEGLKTLFVCTSVCYIALSMFRIVFQGLLEKPASVVEHLEAGAGDWGLIIQFLLACATFLLAFAWLLVGEGWKISALVLAALAPVLFLVSARGLQRFAPGYTDQGFELLQAESERRPLKEADVRARLGEPLVRGASRWDADRLYWVYSYMPSCGYGWDKKYVFLDRSGRVKEICTIREP